MNSSTANLARPETGTMPINNPLGNGIDPRVAQARATKAAFKIPIDPPNLAYPSVEFDFENPPFDQAKFTVDLVNTMVANMGLGLAAPQVGVDYRIIAIRGEPTMLVMFNPKIVATSDDIVEMEEGCLSFNGVYIKVKRPRVIRVRYAFANGEIRTDRFEGMSARIIQHEIDHLDGITMFNRAHPVHREKGLRKLKQIKRRSK